MSSLRRTLALFERPLRYVMGTIYVVAGVLHFRTPAAFERVVPPSLPRPRALVYVSGVAEVVFGVGVLFERTRRLSAWGIVALLVAVFPANVYMATDNVADELVPEGMERVARVAAWVRLPLQGVLVLWAWWHSKPDAESGV
ncbi:MULTISPECIES: DoxX family membrane protein [Halobacterium]|uniref:DoxX family protein n=1 Tax=Halobacterium TaxID=2239 RepID=UPI00073E6529|nr:MULTISPECIES: DoxX family membrane protein [Halobacterium]MCG1002071.1 DoxX family membrane protein [Halobacterium noricense]